MIHTAVAAQVAKTKSLRHEVEGEYRPLERAPSRNGPVIGIRRSLSRALVALGDRLDPGTRRVAVNDPCA